MKLQYQTVEYNISELNKLIKLYNEAYNLNDSSLCKIIMDEINNVTMDLRESIKKGHWYSNKLKLLNGPAYKNPIKFYIEFNSIY